MPLLAQSLTTDPLSLRVSVRPSAVHTARTATACYASKTEKHEQVRTDHDDPCKTGDHPRRRAGRPKDPPPALVPLPDRHCQRHRLHPPLVLELEEQPVGSDRRERRGEADLAALLGEGVDVQVGEVALP